MKTNTLINHNYGTSVLHNAVDIPMYKLRMYVLYVEERKFLVNCPTIPTLWIQWEYIFYIATETDQRHRQIFWGLKIVQMLCMGK